jgi:hypothetical protein
MSNKCQTNVKQMSIKCQTNVKQMSNKCTGNWWILKFFFCILMAEIYVCNKNCKKMSAYIFADLFNSGSQVFDKLIDTKQEINF